MARFCNLSFTDVVPEDVDDALDAGGGLEADGALVGGLGVGLPG